MFFGRKQIGIAMNKVLVIILFLTSNHLWAQFISKSKVPGQPYNKYQFANHQNNHTCTMYLSEFDSKSRLPLIVYIQGSGNSSLFSKDESQRIRPMSGHISWNEAVKGKAKLLIIEKPGVEYLDTGGVNFKFDQQFSLTAWSNTIQQAIQIIIHSELIDTSLILVAGHSEGGLVAATIGNKMKDRISHVAILAGEGPSQLYSLYKFADRGVFFNTEILSSSQLRIDSLKSAWKNILKDPYSVTNKFWGFTYLRWSSFLSTSVSEQLDGYSGNIFIIQGEADQQVYPESAVVLYTSLLAKNKNVQLDMVSGADHSFNNENNPTRADGWVKSIHKVLNWFIK